MNFKKVLFIGFSILFLASCGTKKKVVKQQKTTKPKVVIVETPQESIEDVKQEEHVKEIVKTNSNLNRYTLQYINKFAPIAVSEMKKYKIPASITLAQGILESGNGRSDLATRSNNHFGIKCHKGWKGRSVNHDDDEKGECFRKYEHPDTSYKDHSQFLVGRKRYASLFQLGLNDYEGWAKGLRKAGYATDRKYPQKLIRIIERYQLYKFDATNQNEIISDETEIDTSKNIDLPESVGNYYKVKKGDTLYSIARNNKITVDKLKEINGLTNNSISIGQYLLVK